MGLKEDRAALMQKAGDIIAEAKTAGRDLTPDEVKSIEGLHEQVAAKDTAIAQAAKSADLMAKFDALSPADEGKDGDDTQAKSLGDHFVKAAADQGDDALARLKNVRGTTIASTEFKAATDPHLIGTDMSEVLTDVDKTIVRTYRRPTVADVFGTGSLSGNAVTYFVESPTVEGGFDTVAEGAAKPQLHIGNPTAVTDVLKKIAAWWDMSDEMVEDAAFLVSEINQRGLYLLSLAEENQLLNGDGTGTNLLGVLERSGIQTETQGADPDTAADALFRAQTKVQTATGLSADALLINPVDYQALRLSKDANEQYFGGGFFAGQYGNGGVPVQPPVWGLNTIVTPAVPAKTAVVGAFKAATTVYRKGGVRVESTNSDRDKFTTNKITTRVEERLALAVRVPAAIVQVTLL